MAEETMIDVGQSPYLRLIARIGNTRHPGGLKASDALLTKTAINKSFRVLDVGCGAGHSSAHIAEKYGCTVVGVDIAPDALVQARSLYRGEPYFDRLSFLHAELSYLPFSDGYFDLVLCESVLLFVKDKAQAIGEMARVVKPEGFMLLNELCVAKGREQNTLKNYFARAEFGGHLVGVESYRKIFAAAHWSMLVQDELVFDIKDQLKSDIAQFGNKKGLLQLLELAHSSLTDTSMRQDLWKLLKFVLTMPPKIFSELISLRLLLKKKS